MFFATCINVSVIYRYLCYRQGVSGGSYLLPLSILLQSFTAPVLLAGGSEGSYLMPISILFQSFTTPVL
jgi:hypothetical protein